jgi:HAD superfamily hydrolase (TIGR01450 family)
VTTPINGAEALLFDLDGVVYTGRHAIPGAVDAIERARATGIRIGYITNNASRTTATVAEHLSSFGLTVVADDVVSSPQAGVRVLADLVPAGARILVVGGEGLSSVVADAGFRLVDTAEEAEGVIQGFHPTVAWTDLAEAAFAVQRGVPWVATNQDWTIPQERGIAPGNGTLVSAVHTAAGVLATVAGKPERPIFDLAAERFGTTKALVVGDRLDTDILGANNAGLASALVLTGIDHGRQLLGAVADQRPTYILKDLTELDQEYPDTHNEGALYGVRESVVRRNGNAIEILQEGDHVDLLRAACDLVWDSGLALYAFEVPEMLFDLA